MNLVHLKLALHSLHNAAIHVRRISVGRRDYDTLVGDNEINAIDTFPGILAK